MEIISKSYLSLLQIVRDIGGYSMGQADLVRRAMGKKEMDVMEKERKNFIYGQKDDEGNIVISGALRNGVDEKSANEIFDLMIDFANYAFNKSHSAAYALVAFRTGWLKHYYPVEFMAAQISSIMSDTSSVSLYIQECKRLGIDILPPSINDSFEKFTVSNGKIRFGLRAVKNVGVNLIAAIIQAREDGEFASFTDFTERVQKVDRTAINKRAVESLIKAGAMDSLEGNRAQLLAVYEKIIDSVNSDIRGNIAGQASIFDTVADVIEGDNLPNINEFPQKAILAMEKEILGIYISGHPLEPYKEQLEKISTITTPEILGELEAGNLSNIRDGQRVIIGGIVVNKKNMITRNNNMMAFITVEDIYSSIECIVFPKIYEAHGDLLYEDNVIVIRGKLSLSEVEEPKIICESIKQIDEIDLEKLYVKIDENKDENIFKTINSILRGYPGKTPVYLYLEETKKLMVANKNLWIDKTSSELVERLKELLGEDAVKFAD